jgi:hypothetical protein
MTETFVAHQAAAEQPACAVCLGKTDFVDGIAHVDHRNDGYPLKPSSSLAADIDQPLIVAAADCFVDFWF